MITKYSKEIKLVSLVIVFKILIVFLFPLTGDEAYFIEWANNLNIGYYDHPPMVGWLIYLMQYISGNYVFFRFFSVITSLIVAFIIYKLAILSFEKEKSFYISLIYLASPINLLTLLFSNDIPLFLFGSFSAIFFYYSFIKPKWFLYTMLSGIFLGLAFLSKYFAVFFRFRFNSVFTICI